MELATPITFFLFGLIVGSFLNVLILRTAKEEPLGGRSHCPHCQALIPWYDNVPVLSFFFLGGQCRTCQGKISWQYPLVELATSFLFVLAGVLVFQLAEPMTWLTALWWCFLFSTLIAIAVYDLQTMEIPVSFLIAGVVGTTLYFLVRGLLEDNLLSWEGPLVQALVGGLVAAAFFYALVFFSSERWMGMGDVWLGLIAGMAVGPHFLLLLLTLAFSVGAIVAVGLMLFRGKQLSSQVPFAPYLCLATIILLGLSVHPPTWLGLFLIPPAL